MAVRQLAVDADEVTIARRLYRSGESEYRINKTAVRLKDVTELLMDTGLGRDGYSIIGQGRIEEIVSSKPTQRREIFEEAAGISKYRYRKAEAEKKLESAYENLLRLKDIMAELQDRLEPLREQSEKAQRFLQLSEEKKTLEISLWTHTRENTRQRLEEEQQQVLLEKNELSDIQALLAEQQHRLEEGFEQVQQLTVQIDTGRQQIAQMKNSLSGCDSGIAVAENDLVHNQRSIDEAHEEILSYTQGKDETKQRFRENQEQLLQKQKLLEKAQQDESLRLNEVDSIEQELRQLTTEIAQMKGSRAALEQDITRQKLNRVSSSALLEETQNRLQSLNDHYSERQQNIAPEGRACQRIVLPEAAGRPKEIFRRSKAQHGGMKVPHIPRRTGLTTRISEAPYGAEGERDHHAAPDQVGEDIPIGAVKHHQRHADQRRQPYHPAAEGTFVRARERCLQNAQEDHAGHPAEFRHIKHTRRRAKQQQIQRPVKRAQREAAVEAEQQKILLRSAFPIRKAGKARPSERDQ